MAAKLERGPYLSSFVGAISRKLSSIREDGSVLEGNDSALELLLERLDDCLADVEPVLDDAELKQFRNERVKKWLVDLQDALYMADDFLDELSTKATTATPRDPGNSYDWSRAVDSIIDDSGVNNVIENIVGTLEAVVGRKDKLRLKESAKLDASRGIETTPLIVSSDIIGRNEDKEKIINMLLDNTNDAESRVTVISIVGMGGIGKTTLAQLVYNDAKLVGEFDTKAWVCVAENSDPINVTKKIVESIDSSPCNMDRFDLLQTNLNEKFTGRKFLVVLDDVWHFSSIDWEKFLQPFRNGNIGSKILLTTRNQNFASSFVANNLPYRLNLLSKEDCWSVFLMNSSISMKSPQYRALKPIGEKIVEKCKGLPLAVKTLGGLLSNNYDEEDWENILQSEIWELSEYDCEIVSALRVSYHYLPSCLKRCFVYCSLFPQDYQFDKDELILLWMAEDLLKPEKNSTLENIGCAYFDELVARSFFQPSGDDEKLFVMHDLMHDLATFFAGEFYFKLKERGSQHDRKTRHLSCATKYENSIKLFRESCDGAVHIRTFLDFTNPFYCHSIDIESDSWFLQQQLGCLRVFSSGLLEKLPNSIGELIHLRYLNLSDTFIVVLSESICKLYNLQTLKLKDCKMLEKLPSRLQDLVKLRHLDIRGTSRLKEMPKGMRKLKHLNFLSDYIVGKHEENGIRELGTLDNLHGSFCISKLENVKNSGEALEAKMGSKKHINTLKLEWLPDVAYDVQTERDILEKLQPHQNLKKLSIWGYCGETFPNWLGHSGYSKMTKLSLKYCLNCCVLPSLGQLPSLQHLEISGLDGLEKIWQEKPFKSLETLKIENMSAWREWHFPDEFDSFPKLRILLIRNCPVLSGDLPAHLPTLEKLTIDRCEELACLVPRDPNLHNVVAKTYLSICGCSKLTFSEQLQHKSLRTLEVSFCDFLTFSLGDFPNLEKFEIAYCKRMEYVVVPQALPSLHSLRIKCCSSLVSLPVLGLAVPHLQELKISNCSEIDCFAEDCLPPSLKILKVYECHKLTSWIASKGLQSPGLTHLELNGCNDVKSFPREACLPASLESLQLCTFPNLETLHCKGFHHLTSLKYLEIEDCPNLKNITQEHLLPSIENFRIWENCPLIGKLKEIEGLQIEVAYYKTDSD